MANHSESLLFLGCLSPCILSECSIANIFQLKWTKRRASMDRRKTFERSWTCKNLASTVCESPRLHICHTLPCKAYHSTLVWKLWHWMQALEHKTSLGNARAHKSVVLIFFSTAFLAVLLLWFHWNADVAVHASRAFEAKALTHLHIETSKSARPRVRFSAQRECRTALKMGSPAHALRSFLKTQCCFFDVFAARARVPNLSLGRTVISTNLHKIVAQKKTDWGWISPCVHFHQDLLAF